MVCRTGDLRPTLFGEAVGGTAREWSAAAVQSNRLAALRTPADGAQLQLSAVTASGCDAFSLEIELPQLSTGWSGEGHGPITPAVVEPTRAVGSTFATHEHEVQSVAAAGGPTGCVFAASIDSSGRAQVVQLSGPSDSTDAQPSKRARVESGHASSSACWRLDPTIDPLGCGAHSWAGVAIAPGATGAHDLSVATAHFCSRRLSFYRGAEVSVPERTVYAYQQPTDITFLSSPTSDGAADATSGYAPRELIAVTEGHQLSVWDVRASNACVARLSPDSGDLHAVCQLGSGAVACAGRDRIVHVIDCKMWRARARWNHALKYSVANLCATAAPATAASCDAAASESDSQSEAQLCFATDTGTDLGSSLICDEDSRPADAPSFRGDSPWVGASDSSHSRL